MKYKFYSLFFLFTLAFSISMSAQKKMETSLDALLQSEFIKKFQEMRVSVISSATAFRSQENSGRYSPEDKERVERAYTQTAEKFNFVLLGLKNDLLDRKKLKFITKYPEDYQKQLELDLIKLSEFYAVNYQQVMAEVADNNQVDGVAILPMINDIVFTSIGVFQLVKGIVNYIKYNRQLAKVFSEKELEKRLIKPHKFPAYQELGQQNNGYNQGGGYENDQLPTAPHDNVSWNWQLSQPVQSGNNNGPDKDGDGVADTQDRCPTEYGSRDAMGCPDTDGDGVGDKFDKCKYKYGSIDAQGCPDRDGDGIADTQDRCPNESGNGSASGCPSSGEAATTNPDTDGNGQATTGRSSTNPTTPAPRPTKPVEVFIPAKESKNSTKKKGNN